MPNVVKLTTEKREQFLEFLAAGHAIGAAAKALGVCRQTVRAHRVKDPDFDQACKEVLNARVEVVEDALFEKAKEGNVTACIFWLCNRHSDRWRNVNQVTVNQETHVHNNRIAIAELAREEIVKREQLLANGQESRIGGNGHDN